MKIEVHKYCSKGMIHYEILAAVLTLDNENCVMTWKNPVAPPFSDERVLGTAFSEGIVWSYRVDDKRAVKLKDMGFEEVLSLCRRQANIEWNSYGELRSKEESAKVEREVGPKFADGEEDLTHVPGMGDKCPICHAIP